MVLNALQVWVLATAGTMTHMHAAVAAVVVSVSGFKVELAVQGPSAFRLSACKAPCTPTQIQTVMLDPDAAHAAATTTASSIKTAFGTLALDASGTLTLSDPAGKVLSSAPLSLNQTADAELGTTTRLSFGKSTGAKLYGAGAGHTVGFELAKTESNPKVANTELEVSRFWSTDGFAALGVTPLPSDPNDPKSYPAAWKAGQTDVSYSIKGKSADIYLMPSADAFAGLQAHWALTGQAALPPRYAFGFMACRWGWRSAEYIETMLNGFRTGGNITGGGFPIDAWISDVRPFTRLCCASWQLCSLSLIVLS